MPTLQSPPTEYVQRATVHGVPFPGPHFWSKVRIRFDKHVNLGVKISTLEIDQYILHGVVPLFREGDWCVCIIDQAEYL